MKASYCGTTMAHTTRKTAILYSVSVDCHIVAGPFRSEAAAVKRAEKLRAERPTATVRVSPY